MSEFSIPQYHLGGFTYIFMRVMGFSVLQAMQLQTCSTRTQQNHKWLLSLNSEQTKPGEVARVVKTFDRSAMVRPGRVSEFQVWWEIREWWIKDGNRRWHYLRKWVWRPEVLWEGMKLSVYNVVCKTLQNTGESRSDAWLMGGLLAALTLKQWCSSSETLCNAHRNAQNEQDACRKSLDLFGLVSETLWSSLHCSTLLACDWDITSIMQSPSQDEYLSVSFARCSRWNSNLVRAVYFVPGFKLGERLWAIRDFRVSLFWVCWVAGGWQ